MARYRVIQPGPLASVASLETTSGAPPRSPDITTLPSLALCSDNSSSCSTQVNELGFVPLSKTGAELLLEMLSQRYERGSTLITSNLPFQEWTEVLGSERFTGALLDRLTHHVHILEMNGDSYRLKQSRRKTNSSAER